MRRTVVRFALVLICAAVVAPSTSQASIGLGSGTIAGKHVKAQVNFAIVNGNLQLTLTNTGAETYTADQILTGIAFNLNPSKRFEFIATSSTVVLAGGSRLYYDKVQDSYLTNCNISQEWGLAKNVGLSYASGQTKHGLPVAEEAFQFMVTATKPVTTQTNPPISVTQFLGGEFSVPRGPGVTPRSNGTALAGADFGLVNYASRAMSAVGNNNVVVDSVVITLTPDYTRSAVPTLSDIVDASFAYGYVSNTNGTHRIVGIVDDIVPEPATVAVWSLLGLCWAGMRVWQQRRAPTRAPSLNRGRSAVRPPWPNHVREAILEIIDRGCHHR
jgi:hypothetical protein